MLAIELFPGQVLVPGLVCSRQEEVSLQLHRLANLAVVLATLQRERVDVTVTAEQLERGEEAATMDLLWAIVRHWQFHQVLIGPSQCTEHIVHCIYNTVHCT